MRRIHTALTAASLGCMPFHRITVTNFTFEAVHIAYLQFQLPWLVVNTHSNSPGKRPYQGKVRHSSQRRPL